MAVLLLPHNFTRVFIIPQAHKVRVPQVTIRYALGELHLRHQLGFEPNAVLHFLACQRPLCTFLLSHVSERASVSLQVLQLRPHITPQTRHETIPHLAGQTLACRLHSSRRPAHPAGCPAYNRR